MTSPSTRPVTADDLAHAALTAGVHARGARRGRRDAATVGTTKRGRDVLAGQQRQRAHLHQRLARRVRVQRAHARQARCSARSSRSRHSSCRTSPTMRRDGRIRSASLTRRRSGISPVPSRFGCRVCIATTSGSRTCSSKTSSTVTTRSRRRDRAAQRVEHRGLARLRAAGDEDVQAGDHGRLEEARGVRGDRADRGRARRASAGSAETCGCSPPCGGG